MSHLCLVELYPAECAEHDYKVVGLANRAAEAEMPTATRIEIQRRVRELLNNNSSLAKLRFDAQSLVNDPWRQGIERFYRCGHNVD